MSGHVPATRRPTGLTVGQIARAHGAALRATYVLSPEQHAVLTAIERCRTAALGGHLHVCRECGHEQPRYNSCRNRHCPGCQSLAQHRWLEARRERILETGYFHVVFTVPEALRALFLRERVAMFGHLMEAAKQSLLVLAADPKRLGALPAITLVLHTWTRELVFHPHVHAVVSAGGLDLRGGAWVQARSKGRFLFPVKVLSRLVRGAMRTAVLAGIEDGSLRLRDGEEPAIHAALFEAKWLVYAKAPFGGADHVFAYLGRYTHRVGLSNARLLASDEQGVTFATKHGRSITLAPEELLRRLLLHVLPKGFHKIRHAGLCAPTHVRTGTLDRARDLLLARASKIRVAESRPPRTWFELVLALVGHDPRRCPRCFDVVMDIAPLPSDLRPQGIDSS